ncbi:MAG: acyl-CoA dehydrogenase family protein [Planctomycetota bacterium]
MTLLTPMHLDYQARMREVAEKYIRPVAAKHDVDQSYPHDVMQKINDADLNGVWIPKEYGGKGAGVLTLCLVVEEISRCCGGIGVSYAVNALGSFPIILSGNEAQKQKYLPPIAKGQKKIAFCLSEKEAGSDAGSLSCKAEKKGSSYVINGEKKWTTNGGVADTYTVFTNSDASKGTRGMTALIVPRETKGCRLGKYEDKMGIRCVPVNEMHFEECSVPEENRLDQEGRGFYVAMQTLDYARPGVAAQAVGLAQGALDLAVQYVGKRKQFGESISSFQGIQWMIADMATKVEAARQLVYTTAAAIDAGDKGVSKKAAMAKVFATDVAMEVTTNAVQLFGGYGFMKDYPIEKYMRDAKITQIYEGTNQIQRLVISRAVIKETASMARTAGS